MKISSQKLTILLAGVALLVSSCVKNNSLTDQCLNTLLRENNLPGLNFSMINVDGTQQDYSIGFADTIKGTPMSTEHVLFSGSVGKTYAVALLMQLVDEGKVDISKKYTEYFPELEWLKRLPAIEEISIEMLLQHCSGLPEYVGVQAVWDSLVQNPDKVWSYKDRLEHIMDTVLVHPPGEGWYYSDTNYILIGMLIEKICNADYYDILSSRILSPGELQSTYASVKRDIKNLPNGYSRLNPFFRMPGETVVDGKYVFNPQMEWTGGGIASTTSDLARWAKYYYEGRFFSEELLQVITTPSENGLEIGENMSYGMGSFIYQTKHGIAYAHTGFVPGFNSIFAYFPESNRALALQVNCDYASHNYGLIHYLETILDSLD